jgi:hypothetical protein
MLSRLAASALVATALTLASSGGGALADEPPKAAAPAQAPATVAPSPPPAAQPHGAVVVAASEGAGPAARALAFDLYRDADLRPSIDDATARVLAGDAPADDAPARLKELAELRLSIVHAWPPAGPTTGPAAAPRPADPGAAAPPPGSAGSELVARRLLASLGAELGAALVVAVTLDGTHPVARALRPAAATFERVELGPNVEIGADGSKVFHWPGAAVALRALAPGAAPVPPPPPPAPLAPKKEEAAPGPTAPTDSRPFYKSPWFWGAAGGAAAIGLSVFLISRATSSATDVHLTGKVGP